MIIKNIEAIPMIYPLNKSHHEGSSRGWTTSRSCVLVMVQTESDVIGIGDCFFPAAAVASIIEQVIKPIVIGRSIFDRNLIYDEIISGKYVFGRRGILAIALSGLDIALWDCIGKELNRPIYELLGGGGPKEIAAYASCGHFTEASGIPDLDTLKREADFCRSGNFQGMKIKCGKSPSDDAKRVQTVKKILGNDFPLMVDYNGNYTLPLALKSIAEIYPYNITWIEEPLPPENIQGYTLLKEKSPIPIAVGEAEENVFDLKEFVIKGAADIIMPDLSKCGGISAGMDMVRLGRMFNIRISPHVWSSAIGVAASAHLCQAITKYPHTLMEPEIFPWFEYDTGHNALRSDILTEPIVPNQNGAIVPSRKPGLGVDLNWGVVERYKVNLS